MKRFHVHVRVKNLEESINFYNALFNEKANVVKGDYAKWMLEDPKINFAISSGRPNTGIEHLGIEVVSNSELEKVYAQMNNAKGEIREEGHCTCCYAKSQKSWITDPQNVNWEVFHTYGDATVYGEGENARPAPESMENWAVNEGMQTV